MGAEHSRTPFATEAAIPPSGAQVSEVAAWLDGLAAATGEPAYARAATALRQSPPGRPPVDDSAALRELESYRRDHPKVSLTKACERIGRRFDAYPETTAESVGRRLLRKYRAAQAKRGNPDQIVLSRHEPTDAPLVLKICGEKTGVRSRS